MTKGPSWRQVRRAARKELAGARASLRDRGRPVGERIHDVRTAIKKVRAQARLVERAVGRPARKADRRLRAVAAKLSPLRDAEVLLASFDRLWPDLHAETATGRARDAASKAPPRAGDGPLRSARARLAARLATQVQASGARGPLAEVRAALRRARRRIGRWTAGGQRRSEVARALTADYRRGRQAMARSAAEPHDVAALHRWRRAVKRHRNQLRVFGRSGSPEEQRARLDGLDRLGELLGEEHDLFLLEVELGTLLDGEPLRRARLASRQRRGRLRAEALPLGRRLFAEQPAALARRLLASA